MSNIFNQQLEQALKLANSSLQQNDLAQDNAVRSSKLGLYHAHGLTSKCENKLEEDQARNNGAAVQSKVAAIGTTAAQNVLTAANAAILDVSGTTSSASATAASIQKAATALTMLSGNVATTLAVATSLDKGSKIQKFVEKAAKSTKEAAKLAEEASLIALDLTIEASQSRAAGVVTQATAVKTNVAALQKSLTDTFDRVQGAITEDLSDVSSAVAAESEQAGIYKTSLAEDKAIRSSQMFINKHINNNLVCTIFETDDGCPGDQFTLSFSAFDEKESGVQIIREYRIMIVKEDDAAAFNTELAKTVQEVNYVRKAPAGAESYSQTYVTPDFIGENKTIPLNAVMARDYTGFPVVRGVPYTFFVYVVYTTDYQTHYNDTNGVLSLPSPDFTLQTTLPVVAFPDISMLFYRKNVADAVRIVFKVPVSKMTLSDGADLNELMEFRSFIFSGKDCDAFTLNQKIDQAIDTLFALEQDFRNKEERHQLAEQAYNNAIVNSASAAEIQQLKNDVDIAKALVQAARADYNEQINTVDLLNQTKISDFYIDEEILETIPASEYLVATRNQDLPDELKQRIDAMNDELAGHKKQFDANAKRLKDLGDQSGKLEEKMKSDVKQEDPMPDEIAKLRQDLADNIAKLQAIHSEKVMIRSESDATEFMKQISDEQSEQYTLLNQIIADFQKLSSTEVTEVSLAAAINSSRIELRKLNTESVLLTAQQSMLQDELKKLPADIEKASAQLASLKQGEPNTVYEYYEAVNESGDFTDNYGEPLVTGNLYCAVIMSVIRGSEPEAAPFYQNMMSDFSGAVLFNLQQI